MKVYFSGTGWDELLRDNGAACVLISYANIRTTPRLTEVHDVLKFPDIMVDSGAFSVATGRAAITVEEYTNWLITNLSRYPRITCYVNLDDISSHEVSRHNQQYMESMGLSPLPVYHYGEPPDVLDAMCEKVEYVGLGGIAGRKLTPHAIRLWWEFINERHPDNHYHVFGVGQVNPLVKHPPYSVDTTTWLAARFGNLLCMRNGLPSNMEIPQISSNPNPDGARIYFTWPEVLANNIRALLDWQDWNWAKYVKQNGDQERLL